MDDRRLKEVRRLLKLKLILQGNVTDIRIVDEVGRLELVFYLAEVIRVLSRVDPPLEVVIRLDWGREEGVWRVVSALIV